VHLNIRPSALTAVMYLTSHGSHIFPLRLKIKFMVYPMIEISYFLSKVHNSWNMRACPLYY